MVKKISDGNIPVLMAKGKSLAEAWENSMLKLYRQGIEIRTEYDQKDDKGNFVFPPSIDTSMIVVVEDPTSEPFIHRAFPGGLEDLEEYRQEVMYGIKDHWVRDPTDPEDKRWEYTYHKRLFDYSVPLSVALENAASLPDSAKEIMKKDGIEILLEQPWVRVEDGKEKTLIINQLEACVDKLSKVPYSRRVQAVTWKVWEDLTSFDPACLQSIWVRMLRGNDGKFRLNMNVRFRSRDAYDAAYMNMFALICLHEEIAKQISEKRGEEILVGRYADLSDSYHIYGKRRDHFKEGFLKLVKKRSFEDRTWTREFAEIFFEEARPMIKAKIEKKDKGG